MSSLPPALDFPAMEAELVEKWKKENTFHTQDKLSLERGDEVRLAIRSVENELRFGWSLSFLKLAVC